MSDSNTTSAADSDPSLLTPIVKKMDRLGRAIFTEEVPVEYPIEPVCVLRLPVPEDPQFSDKLCAALRQDVDTVIVGQAITRTAP